MPFVNDGSRVFLLYRPLPDDLRPCAVVRNAQASLLLVDPDVTCVEATTWVVQWMTIAEQNTLRAGFDAPPVGEPGPDKWVSDDPAWAEVPPSLRLPAEARAVALRSPSPSQVLPPRPRGLERRAS